MISENIEDYYNELITYWPTDSLISLDHNIKYKFNNKLGEN